MRLLSTSDFSFIEIFPERDTYTTLSHTWGPDELTYQDWLYIHDQSPRRWGWVRIEDEVKAMKATAGYDKIVRACQLAAGEGYEWIWIDTVCIDKMNLAELSETINSMFDIYAKCSVCYAFLSDIAPGQSERPLEKSRWFTRGWTLQELLAPPNVHFLARDWSFITTRHDVREALESSLMIPREVMAKRQGDEMLHRPGGMDGCHSIAQRMAWASDRQTTRPEDEAYCLLGIFGVNMPLLYGEGFENAFERLQNEILRASSDWSIFAWGIDEQEPLEGDETYEASHTPSYRACERLKEPLAESFHFTHFYQSPLAINPKSFKTRHRTAPLIHTTASRRIGQSNLGLEVNIPIINTMNPRYHFGVLPYQRRSDNETEFWFPLGRIDYSEDEPPHQEYILQRAGFPSQLISSDVISFPAISSSDWAETTFIPPTSRRVFLGSREATAPRFHYQCHYLMAQGTRLHGIDSRIPGACLTSIMLVFPGPVSKFEFIEFWPRKSRPLDVLFNLSTIKDQDTGQMVPIGGIRLRYQPTKSELEMYFLARIPHDDTAKTVAPSYTGKIVGGSDVSGMGLSLEERTKSWAEGMLLDGKHRIQTSEGEVSSSILGPTDDGTEHQFRVCLHANIFKGARTAALSSPDRIERLGHHWTAICRFVELEPRIVDSSLGGS